jgi:hypothetical protein
VKLTGAYWEGLGRSADILVRSKYRMPVGSQHFPSPGGLRMLLRTGMSVSFSRMLSQVT